MKKHRDTVRRYSVQAGPHVTLIASRLGFFALKVGMRKMEIVLLNRRMIPGVSAMDVIWPMSIRYVVVQLPMVSCCLYLSIRIALTHCV